jgi:hypothetical protein
VDGSLRHRIACADERRAPRQISRRDIFSAAGHQRHVLRFEPKEFVASGDKVVALGHYAGSSPLKKHFESDFSMVFTLQEGKVTKFQEFCDSVAIDEAFRP